MRRDHRSRSTSGIARMPSRPMIAAIVTMAVPAGSYDPVSICCCASHVSTRPVQHHHGPGQDEQGRERPHVRKSRDEIDGQEPRRRQANRHQAQSGAQPGKECPLVGEVGAGPAVSVDHQSRLVFRLNELVAACRFDPDRSHDRITDRVERIDRRRQYLVAAGIPAAPIVALSALSAAR